MKKKRIGLNFATKLAIVAAIVLAIGGTTLSYALIDETNSVHIRASEIEDATLIIGTHLIYLGSMNDQIYEIAMKSAEESNQYNRYYKSEIGGGTWSTLHVRYSAPASGYSRWTPTLQDCCQQGGAPAPWGRQSLCAPWSGEWSWSAPCRRNDNRRSTQLL